MLGFHMLFKVEILSIHLFHLIFIYFGWKLLILLNEDPGI